MSLGIACPFNILSWSLTPYRLRTRSPGRRQLLGSIVVHSIIQESQTRRHTVRLDDVPLAVSVTMQDTEDQSQLMNLLVCRRAMQLGGGGHTRLPSP